MSTQVNLFWISRLFSNRNFIIKTSSGIAVIALALWLGIDRLDHAILFEALRRVNLFYMLLASIAIIGVLALSTSRFAYINRKFGGDESWLFLHRVNMLSLLYSQIALPLIAQIIGRVSHGSREKMVYYAPLTVLEKFIALTIMIIFGAAASTTLLNQNIIPEGLAAALTVMACTILFVLCAALFLIFTTDERREFLKTVLKISHLGIFMILSLSVMIQLGILLIYTILALQFVPDAPIMTLVGGFAIVVLATSIPISFGGWGVREAAAAGVFLALGFPPEIGVIIGVLFGLLHLVILVATALVLKPKEVKRKSTSAKAHNPFEGINFWPVTSLLMMILLPFQIRLPLAEKFITLSSADVIALIAMINFILLEWLSGRIKTPWADQLVWPGLIAIGLMIVMGWFVGWLQFGSNEWATANRLIGLVAVFSYLFTGAAMRHYIAPPMMVKFALVLVFSLIASVVIKIIAHNIMGYKADLFFNWGNFITGFIADRNAFAFMAGLAAVLTIFHTRPCLDSKAKCAAVAVLLTMLSTFVLFTGSRSGLGAAGFVLLWLFIAMPRNIPHIVATALGTVAFIQCANLFGQAGQILFLDGRNFGEFLIVRSGRWSTFESGLNLFLANPIFGAGLGAGIRDTGLVIHNTFLWILGEMGLIGAMLCLPLAIAFTRIFFKTFGDKTYLLKDRGQLHALILFVIICGGFGLVQDVAYQRILWFLVGFIMATPRAEKQ
ncbi:lysylphosphatidylglycerol synthase domain-containing protein [Alphaproteobacteria bacterium]|nr:lysylphosphatidylglycerol synthase domain-containing protein [Alphaproteobacteria bacterium]